ncbi:DHA2 family efflux MFS transporter permease subunit [Rhodococcus sp. NBC_00297]|uniref:DHA2 family efflux MFS transporter permease subunit n=1 Tax=Rhodococcus sp. NBC_00297 TaxID=2976005 RepID=UPI002E2A2195|nr:DHA2 family efflux MFS transporter permease subunit [Rhodococcus sp. NBC_00297]
MNTERRHSGRLIAMLVAAAFVVVLNETIMGVAIPRLMNDLAISASTAQWLTTGFMLTMAVVIPLTGYILERFTLRTVFFTAMGLFSTGTLVAAAAPGFVVLLAGRVIQAAGTAMMIPLLMTTVLNLVPPTRRGRMMGVISIVISVAPTIGPTVSGLILSSLHWRWMFLIVLPIAVVTLGLGARWVQNATETKRVKFDAPSVALSAFAFGGLVFGLGSIGESATGHLAVPVWIPTAVGLTALPVFIRRQLRLQRHDNALLDLRTFRSRPFGLAVVLVLTMNSALFGVLIILPIYLQTVRGMTVLQAGLALLPGGLLMGLTAPIVGSMFDRYGPRPLVLPGMALCTAALAATTLFDPFTHISAVVAAHSAICLGFGLAITPLLTFALGSLPPHLYAHGSAMISTVQQFSGAAGTALFVTVMSIGSATSTAKASDVGLATAHGVHLAFLCGAGLALVAVTLSPLIRETNRHQASTVV